MTGSPDRKHAGPVVRAAAWAVVALLGAVAGSIGIYMLVWIWTGILAMAG